MRNKIIAILLLVFVIASVGLIVFQYQKNEKLKSEITFLKNEKNALATELTQIKLQQENRDSVYEFLMGGSNGQTLTPATISSIAYIANDRDICNYLQSKLKQNPDFCYAVFDNNCSKYDNPNRYGCEGLRLIKEGKTDSVDFINLCNSRIFLNDSEQMSCFVDFAKMTDNPTLCDEICKKPVNNTTCKGNANFYIQDCHNYVER